jgi:PIN domain nuclease of toxin-antitoxin system
MQKVVDASALLAFLYNERGADQVRPHLPKGKISAVNAAEVLTVLVRNGVPPVSAAQAVQKTGLEVVDFSWDGAWQTTWLLTSEARDRGISLGDRACLALAISEKLPVITADRNWADLEVMLSDGSQNPLPVALEFIR